MMTKKEIFEKRKVKSGTPNIRPGDTIRIHQKIKEKGKERIQVFEGIVLAKKHGKGISSTITVRKVILGVGVEKIFPIHSPLIAKMEVVKRGKVRRAKLYYLREAKGRKARLKRKEFSEVLVFEEPQEEKQVENKEKSVESEKDEENNSEKVEKETKQENVENKETEKEEIENK